MLQEKGNYFRLFFPEELLSFGRDLNYRKNALICMQNDAPEKIFYLKTGNIYLSYYGRDGERKIVYYAKKGTIFGGEIALAANRPVYGITAVALTNCLVTVFSKDVFLTILLKNLDFTNYCLQETSDKLFIMGKQLGSISFLECKRRVASTLLWLAENMSNETETSIKAEGVECSLKITHQELGEFANVNRVTVTNVLTELEEAKIIHKRTRNIMITDGGKEKLKQWISEK